MRLGSASKGAVVTMTLLFALFLVFSGYALVSLFYPHWFSYGKGYFDMLLTQYLGSIVFSLVGLTVGIIVLYKSKER